MSSAPRHRSGKVLATCLGACLLAVLAVRGVAAEPVSAGAAVRTTTTTTLRGQGDVPIIESTTVPASTAPTTTAPPTTAVPSTTIATALQNRASDSADATTRLNRVVIGLLALAALITVATIVFWRMTRPDRPRRGARPAAHWVGEDGEVPLPDDPTAAELVADPSAWSVDPAPVPIPTLDDPAEPVPAATPSAGPAPSPDPGDATGPVVVVESVDRGARRRATPDASTVDGTGGGWAPHGWDEGASGDPDAR